MAGAKFVLESRVAALCTGTGFTASSVELKEHLRQRLAALALKWVWALGR
jgi:hypothetical protein